MVKENLIPKVEEIREIKNKIPSYEEFLRNYDYDEGVSKSYENEYDAEVSQNLGYGPGKKDFKGLYKRIKSQIGKPTCKISYFSDDFNPNKNYAGMIVYAIDGKYQWLNEGGKAKGWKGRSFYLSIQCSNDWPSDVIRETEQGRVHHYLIKNVLGFDYSQDVVCCGGFAWHNGELKFSSVWLNGRNQVGWESDGEKNLSPEEKMLVQYCFEKYKENGKHHIFEIPDYLDRYFSN